MGTTVETVLPLGEGQAKSDRVAIINNPLKGSFVADDTDNHDYPVASIGKGRMTVALDNQANQDATVTIYGMHDDAGTVGDIGTFLIGSFTVTALNDKGYEVINDPFPFYLIRVAYGVTPTDDPKKTTTVYMDLFAF